MLNKIENEGANLDLQDVSPHREFVIPVTNKKQYNTYENSHFLFLIDSDFSSL